MFCMLKRKIIYHDFVPKHNSNWAKQVILLIISNREKFHYLPVKKSPSLVREITSKNNSEF